MEEKKVDTETSKQTEDALETALNDAVTETITPKDAHETTVSTSEETPAKTQDVNVGKGEEAPEKTAKKYEVSTYSPDDAIIERAVRAGLSLADVKSFSSQESADRMIEIAERANKAKSEETNLSNKSHNVDEDEPDDEMGKAIKAMEDDKDEDGNPNYDPNIVKLLKGLYGENRKLKAAGEYAARTSVFEKLFDSIDDGVRSHVDAAHKSQLKAKFDMLLAGYKATKAEVSENDVFQEATQLALGDLITKASEESKAKELEERRRLMLARPGGENGQHRHKGPVTEEDIASELWDQING